MWASATKIWFKVQIIALLSYPLTCGLLQPILQAIGIIRSKLSYPLTCGLLQLSMPNQSTLLSSCHTHSHVGFCNLVIGSQLLKCSELQSTTSQHLLVIFANIHNDFRKSNIIHTAFGHITLSQWDITISQWNWIDIMIYCCPLKVSEQRDIHPQCCCNGIADDFSEGKPR